MIDFLLSRSTSVTAHADSPFYENGVPNPGHPFWYSNDTHMTDSGEIVTPESAMRVSAVLGCVRVLSESVATLPCHLYERMEDGSKRKATDHYLYDVIHAMPNMWQTSVEYYDLCMNYLLLGGNALSRIVPGPRGSVAGLELINPRKIKKVEQLKDGSRRYYIDKDSDEWLDSSEVFHVAGMSSNGLWGESVLGYARGSVGMALGAEKIGNQLFKQGMRPSGVLSHPNHLSEEAIDRLRKQMGEMHAGNFHKPMVLEEGMSWAQMSVTPEDAQFLETRKFQIEEICRIFRVPLHMVQSLDRATFNNIEHLSIQFVIHTLRPWLVRFEQAMRRDLIYQRNRFFVEFNVDGLLRGDAPSRFAAYASAIQHEWLSPDEVRAMENRNPRDDGNGNQYRNPLVNTHDNQPASDPPANQMQAIVSHYADDLASRIAARELAQLEKRSKHATADRKRFNEWAAEWYTDHATWVDQQVNGFCDSLGVRESDRIALVQSLTAGTVQQLCTTEDVNAWVMQHQQELQPSVAQALKGLVL